MFGGVLYYHKIQIKIWHFAILRGRAGQGSNSALKSAFKKLVFCALRPLWALLGQKFDGILTPRVIPFQRGIICLCSPKCLF